MTVTCRPFSGRSFLFRSNWNLARKIKRSERGKTNINTTQPEYKAWNSNQGRSQTFLRGEASFVAAPASSGVWGNGSRENFEN